jgi:Ca2+-binding EF-hand superfamily protein
MMRWIYTQLLRLHPRRFREQFAGEMLWIFDQETADGGRRLMADAAVSIVRQWCLRSDLPGARAAGAGSAGHGVPHFYSAPSDGPERSALAQGAVVALALMLGIFFLMGKGGPRRWLLRIGTETPRYGVEVDMGAGPPNLTTKIGVKGAKIVPDHGDIFNYFQMVLVLAAIDADHDLLISDGEMTGAPEALRVLDLNHDGKLSPEECGFGGPVRGQSAEELYKEMISFDSNHDGVLEKSELPPRLRGLLAGAMTDAEGKVYLAEVRNLAGRIVASARLRSDPDPGLTNRLRVWFMRTHPVLAALDTDHDGVISPVEMATAGAALRTLDWNHDKQLTYEEVLPHDVPKTLGVYMIRFDTDGDGKLSMAEIAAAPDDARDMLRSANRDKDGFVTEGELMDEIRRRALSDDDGGARQLQLAMSGQRAMPGK